MHGKYQRNIQHARRGLVLNRQLDAPDGGGGTTLDGQDGGGGGFTLTGPLTITIIRTTFEASSTPTSSSSSEAVATSLPTSPPVESTSSPIISFSQTSSSSSSSSFTLFPSVIPPSSTPSIIPNDTTPEGSNALLTTPLPSGGIAGIVIGCLVLLLLGLFFGLRKRFQRNRIRLRGMWTRNKNIGRPTLIAGNSYEPKSYLDYSFTRNDASQVPGPTSPAPQFSPAVARKISARVPPPPISYNSNEGATSPYSGSSTPSARVSNDDGDNGGGSNTRASNAPVYSPGSTSLSPFAAAVVCTFITSLPDELSIKVGESIRVLAEYDDGWALCMNTSGQQGMVPMECLNRGHTSSVAAAAAGPSGTSRLSAPWLPDSRGVRRTSSLDPVQALKARRS
ncbi:hypothetical protein M413DRAFT_6052 [Hebeloma cylindrosporum]|uniref:SH3 domain-containing protein n=1 Tax=Hebeloma cylindrosporum TaxID=76867 RepID=A0A0C3CXZ2_HEBCY|nr:hypothetical protein M413DRAFT_6052 [Hebeloma cylindrosporum h7]